MAKIIRRQWPTPLRDRTLLTGTDKTCAQRYTKLERVTPPAAAVLPIVALDAAAALCQTVVQNQEQSTVTIQSSKSRILCLIGLGTKAAPQTLHP